MKSEPCVHCELLEWSKRALAIEAQLARARTYLIDTFAQQVPGTHPGRTPEEAAEYILSGGNDD